MRYFLKIAYKGTQYHGWQIQPNALTAQGIIESRLQQILQQRIPLVGSSRTDAGVHAHQQWAHIDLNDLVDRDRLCRQLNATLPPDISIQAIYTVHSTAHARFDALARTYEYTIIKTKDPFLLETSYLLDKKLDIKAMNKAATILRDKKNFKSFSKVSTAARHYLCTILEAQWIAKYEGQLVFRIQANRFLRGMVRSIVSNLLEVGLGRSSVAAFEALIDAKNRTLYTHLVPACGLKLTAVVYPTSIFIQ